MDDGYLISNYHVVKDATKVRLLIRASVLDCASPLALWSGAKHVYPCPHDALRLL
jgi:hypothetical protein